MSLALLILERNDRIFSLWYQDNRLVQVKVHENDSWSLPIGAMYIGKVKNVVSSIDAVFVEVCKDKMGFLPMKQAKKPIILNRKYDGRILAGDEILVQIEKEAVKTKEVGLTCNISFTGKYMVLTTGKPGIGYSGKLDSLTKSVWKECLEEWKIRDVLEREKVGMVVRTNASALVTSKVEMQEEDLLQKDAQPIGLYQKFQEEFVKLLEQKKKVLGEASYRTCFSCLFRPQEGYITDVRDAYEVSFDKIITDNTVFYERIKEEFPTLEKVELYRDSRISLEKLYSVETRLKEALSEKVWLKNGAYLIIQQTEALTVIDVNSGKMQKKNPGDNIYLEINKEAAKEIALQMKLRNLSGIIIIDFISQDTKEQDQELLTYLSRLVKKDAVKTNVIDMTPLGLVEVTRKKIQKSLKEQIAPAVW